MAKAFPFSVAKRKFLFSEEGFSRKSLLKRGNGQLFLCTKEKVAKRSVRARCSTAY
jgi:hypothetical protein